MSSAKDLSLKRPPFISQSPLAHTRRLYDERNLHVSLRQWRMLHAVVDCNGFTGAGQHLHLSQSAISYSIAKLQEQLGLPLLKLEGRKAYLTEDGRVLLERSRNLMREALELELLAESLRKGWGTRVKLEVDRNFPTGLLMTALRKFNLETDNVGLSLKESDCLQADEALSERGADLAIAAQVPNDFAGIPLARIEHVAVAHPDHPLFGIGRPIATEDMDGHIEVVISSSKPPQREPGRRGSTRIPPWHVSEFDTAVRVLRERFAYGWLPRHRIEQLLTQNHLRVLPMRSAVRVSQLYLIQARMARYNPAATRLGELIEEVTHARAPAGEPGTGAASRPQEATQEARQA